MGRKDLGTLACERWNHTFMILGDGQNANRWQGAASSKSASGARWNQMRDFELFLGVCVVSGSADKCIPSAPGAISSDIHVFESNCDEIYGFRQGSETWKICS